MNDKSKQHALRVTEIFYSLQGESVHVGIPTVFIRLSGCPLRCSYCDTTYAFKGGDWLTLDNICAQIANYRTHYITVTGGEPLAQPGCLLLLSMLCDQGYSVSLETSGALDISQVDERVIKVMDFKTPGSSEENRNYFKNIDYLQPHDQIKFVICDRNDYEWAKSIMNTYKLSERCQVLFSPSHGQLSPQSLADWILDDHLNVRFQLQLHKYIWGDMPGK